MDILGVRTKVFKRISSRLGSMLKENEGIIELYHKSLSDWLTSEDNDSFLVDIEEGKVMIDSFINKLTPDTYKKEYLSFFEFNKMLVDNIYIADNTLAPFFSLFEDQEDQKEIIDLLMVLGTNFSLHEKMFKAIAIRRKTLEILE